ncbi:hypothetical protein M8J77_009248, partial [Diaphorina citri]
MSEDILKMKKKVKILKSKQMTLLKYLNSLWDYLKKKDEPDFDLSFVTVQAKCLGDNLVKYEEIIDKIQELS